MMGDLELKATSLTGKKLDIIESALTKFPAYRFLTNPRMPCFIYEKNLDTEGNQKLIAANLGRYENSYFSVMSPNLRLPLKQDYIIEYMAKEENYHGLIFQVPRLFQIIVDEEEIIKMKNFSKLVLKNKTFEDLLNDFRKQGYGIHESFEIYGKTKEISEKFIGKLNQ
ncbi:hypothetical protein KY321_04110 [Candidatus Woesearchaeota archaeon]|nr:hypothetical protein [Candidatus Woesearchaeota archaeon]